MPKPLKHVLVCVQSRPPGHPRGSCGSKGCAEVYNTFMNEFQSRNLWGKFALTNTGCLGPCGMGPSVLVYPDGVMYAGVKPTDVAALIEEHLLLDQPVARLVAPAAGVGVIMAKEEFGVGDIVYSRVAIENDGCIPDIAPDALLARPGVRGVVVNFGHAELDEREEIYLVRFEDGAGDLGPPVGCLPEELTQDEVEAKGLAESAA